MISPPMIIHLTYTLYKMPCRGVSSSKDKNVENGWIGWRRGRAVFHAGWWVRISFMSWPASFAIFNLRLGFVVAPMQTSFSSAFPSPLRAKVERSYSEGTLGRK